MEYDGWQYEVPDLTVIWEDPTEVVGVLFGPDDEPILFVMAEPNPIGFAAPVQ